MNNYCNKGPQNRGSFVNYRILLFFSVFALMLCPAVAADTGEGRIASAEYVDDRIADVEKKVVNNEEFKTFSDNLPQRFVSTTGDQEISGNKTYTSSPIVPTPPLP